MYNDTSCYVFKEIQPRPVAEIARQKIECAKGTITKSFQSSDSVQDTGMFNEDNVGQEVKECSPVANQQP